MTERDLQAFAPPTRGDRPDYYGATDPMDDRYEEEEIQLYFSSETRVACQAHVEAALAHTYADFGKCSREVALEIEAACRDISAKEVEDREKGRGKFKGKGTNHDVQALVDAISARVSDEAKPVVHAAATSYDTISTANSLQYKEGVHRLIIPRLVSLGDVIADLASRYAGTAQVGRTHGQHGVPITFGFATSRYLGRLGESLIELDRHAENLQGKFSGAVGGYNASKLINENPRVFEAAFLAKLGLQTCDHATQIVPAENIIRLFAELTNTSGIMAQIGEDMRNLQRTEIAEVGESFDPTRQTGSSAMPQKRNPINFENAAGIHREVVAQLFNAYQNLVSEHQRDLRDSVSMRFYGIIPAIVARTAQNLARTLSKLEVHDGNLERNLFMTDGAIGSEALQVLMRDLGHIAAHSTVKRVVQGAIKSGVPFRDAVVGDAEIASYLEKMTAEQRLAVLQPESNYLGLAANEARRHVELWKEAKGRLAV